MIEFSPHFGVTEISLEFLEDEKKRLEGELECDPFYRVWTSLEIKAQLHLLKRFIRKIK